VRLPVGAEVLVAGGTLDLAFDAAEGDAWTADIAVTGVTAPGARIGALTLTGGGTIAEGRAGLRGPRCCCC